MAFTGYYDSRSATKHTHVFLARRLLSTTTAGQLLLLFTFLGMPMSRDFSSCMSFDTASSATAAMAVQRSSTAKRKQARAFKVTAAALN
jgi:hypothetical protein